MTDPFLLLKAAFRALVRKLIRDALEDGLTKTDMRQILTEELEKGK